MPATFFDMMAMINHSQTHPSIGLESDLVYDEMDGYTVAQEGFFRDSKTPPKMITKRDTDLVKYMTLRGQENMVMCIPNEKWPKEFLVRNDRALSGFIKQGPDFVRKYTDYLKRSVTLWQSVKKDIKESSMSGNMEKWNESIHALDKLFADLGAINRNFNGWQGDPVDVTDQFRNKMTPILTDFQKVVEAITAEYYEMKGAYFQKSTVSRLFKYGGKTKGSMMWAINEMSAFGSDLWSYISKGVV